MSRIPKRLAGCKGCVYFQSSSGFCDYRHFTGKLRSAQNAPMLPGGGCRLKETGDKYMITSMFSGKPEKRYRVVLPNGRVRYLKEDEYLKLKEEQS